MDLKPLIYCLMLLYCSIIYGQTDNNILDTSTWTIGTGSVAGFSKYGATDENSRVYKDDHLGNEVIVWQASPNGGGGVSGGFTSPIVPIDNTKTYRLSVWIKKTNSNSGSTHLKP